MSGIFRLNSVNYGLHGRIRRRTLPAFTQAFRITGQERPADRAGYTTLMLLPPIRGFGRFRVPPTNFASAAEYERLWDADADIWESGVRLPILQEDSTETGLEVLRAMADFKGDLWSIWDDDSGTDAVARMYDGANTQWTGGAVVVATTSDASVGLDLIAHKTHLIALVASVNDHVISRSTSGSSWSAATTPITVNLLANDVTAHEDINAGLLVEIGDFVLAVIWDEANGTVTVFSSSDAGDNWVDEDIDITTSGGVLGAAAYTDTDGVDKVYVLVASGLYKIDVSAGSTSFTVEKVASIAQKGGIYGGNRLAVQNNRLWIALGVAESEAAVVWTMQVSGDTPTWDTEAGLNVNDGVPAEMLGPVRYFHTAEPFLYASLGGGAADRHARILRHNSIGWLPVRRNGTEDQKIEVMHISDADDDVPRLHYGIRTATDTTNSRFLGQPQSNPAGGVTINREGNGYVKWPMIDGGMPHDDGIWIRIRVSADDLSSNTLGEFIQITYGTDGSDWGTNTDLVNTGVDPDDTVGRVFNGATDLLFGGSSDPGQGKSAKNVALQAKLQHDGGDATDTPVLKSVEANYTKGAQIIEEFEIDVDLDESARLQQTTREGVITKLRTARDLGTLAAFTYEADDTTYYVKVTPGWEEELTEEGGQPGNAPNSKFIVRSGTVTVILKEIIP